jgi:hypothetical protein
VLGVCRELGTTVVWPAVHGWRETHDRMVHRAGAYEETLLGIDRMRSAGMAVGCNVFLTRDNVTQFDALTADLLAHGVTQFAIEVAAFLPTARSRRYEAKRPTLDDLAPLVERIQALPGPFFHGEQWLPLADSTEAAHVRRALEGTWPASDPAREEDVGEELSLICRPNLDLYWGVAGRYRRRFGALRRDDAQAALWFDLDPIPAVRALAERYGDSQGSRVHLYAASARRLWLDRAQQLRAE